MGEFDLFLQLATRFIVVRSLLLQFQPWWSAGIIAVGASVDRPLSIELLRLSPRQPVVAQFYHHQKHLGRFKTNQHVHNANTMSSRSQKYSIYLPLYRPSRATSRATSATKEGARSPKPGDRKSSRTSAAAAAAAAAQSMAKRRSTMNSRDAAYDEEQLRRALEISKEDAILEESDLQPRRPKRGRDDDDE